MHSEPISSKSEWLFMFTHTHGNWKKPYFHYLFIDTNTCSICMNADKTFVPSSVDYLILDKLHLLSLILEDGQVCNAVNRSKTFSICEAFIYFLIVIPIIIAAGKILPFDHYLNHFFSNWIQLSPFFALKSPHKCMYSWILFNAY